MSLVHPVISDLILATLAAERRTEMEQVRMRVHPEHPPQQRPAAPARGGVLGVLRHTRGLLPLHPGIVVLGRSALAAADPRPDRRLC